MTTARPLSELSEQQAAVRQFHLALDIPAPDHPTALGPRHYLRADLINEEAAEFAEAAAAGDTLEMIDALCDLLVVVYGCAVEMGVNLAPFFNEVHRTNMAKVGGPTREDGKKLKPPGWTPPNLAAVYEAMYGEPA